MVAERAEETGGIYLFILYLIFPLICLFCWFVIFYFILFYFIFDVFVF